MGNLLKYDFVNDRRYGYAIPGNQVSNQTKLMAT